jgi:hypothetical protein
MLHVTFAYVLYRYIFFLDLYSSHLHNFIPTEENMQWYTDHTVLYLLVVGCPRAFL